MCVINTGLLQNDIKFRYNDFTLRERGHIKDFVLHKNEILAGEEIFVLCHLCIQMLLHFLWKRNIAMNRYFSADGSYFILCLSIVVFRFCQN